MDYFRIALVILILLIILHLFYKLLDRKHSMVEPLTGEFTTDINDMRTMHSPEIQLPSYRILKVVKRPNDIPISYINAYNMNKNRISEATTELNKTASILKYYSNLKRPRLKTESELKKPKGTRIKNKPWYMLPLVWNNYNQQWNDYAKRKVSDVIRYNSESTAYKVNVMRSGMFEKKKRNIETEIAKLLKLVTTHESDVVKKKAEIAKYNSDNDRDDYRNYLLKDLFFKASYNSAFTGKTMNPGMVELVLKRGCRYIDFEVYKSGQYLYVSSDKSVRLLDVLSVINKSLIGTDPLFINLRLVNVRSERDFFGQIPASVSELFYNRNSRKIDNDTRISEIVGKCIIVTNIFIPNLTNIVSSCKNNVMCPYSYSEIIQFGGNQRSSRLTVVNPDDVRRSRFNWFFDWLFGLLLNLIQSNTNDADAEYLVKNYKTNIIPFRFYRNPKTAEFDKYESIFNDGNCTIVPLKNLDVSSFLRINSAADKIL
jgi:hypothetical protein